MADYPVSVKVADEAGNSTLEVEGLFALFNFIFEAYFQPLIQVGHLSQAFAEDIKTVFDLTEYLLIGSKSSGSAGVTGFANYLDRLFGYALPVFLEVGLAVKPDTDLTPGREGIDYRGADAMQAP